MKLFKDRGREAWGGGKAASLLLALALAGCQEQEQRDIPNRVLDRPTDVALICVEVVCEDLDGDGIEQDDECETQALGLSACERDTGTCTSDNPHLVGFVANSERNEIAMFTKCSNRLVDMNIEVPGYNFIPAGILPTELDASDDSCKVMSANVGSCDITVLDAVELARIGLGRDPKVEEPSELVATLIPQRFDPGEGGGGGQWVPLGARPGEILAVPRTLTLAPVLDPSQTLEGVCDPLAPASAYVSFPTCNLIAEIDLRNGHVLQSRQFIGDPDDGSVMVIDTGITPSCPVECPGQFEQLAAGEIPPVDEYGPFPQALELSLEPVASSEDSSSGLDAADQSIEGQSLFVGGLGSDILFEFPIGDTGEWAPVENQLRLSDASGIKRIRISPAVNAPVFGSSFSQFLYVIAGDGSTRVVGRAIPGEVDEIGIECETQLDPNVVPTGAELACIPVLQTPTEGQPAERRGFARGPGIRPGRGEEVTDWMFRKIYSAGEGVGPFAEPGTVAVGVTSAGTVVYSMIDQERANGQTVIANMGVDPAGTMDMRLFPHSLWPDPSFVTAMNLQLPVVTDEVPQRSVPSPGPTRSLAPSLRRIDSTYAGNERTRQQLELGESKDEADQDRLGDGRIYNEDVARVAVHDFRSWGGNLAGRLWTLEWEGTLPGTASATGRISCANPGWQGGTCLVSEPDDAQLLDASATFCDDGVLAGDKLVLVGCREDAECGDGRRCLRESVAGGESTGICISAQAYAERAGELRQICANFISDPCGEAHREFTITKAFQDRLWIQSMDLPLTSYLESGAAPCATGSNNQLVDGVCECLPGFGEEYCPGTDDPDVVDCCVDPNSDVPPPAAVIEAEDRFICADEQPDDGCTSDAECTALLGDDHPWLCIEERCRRPCEDASECILRRLPGPTCFGEFVRYQVALRNQFQVNGPVVPTNLVEVDPNTGECVQTPDAGVSQLLTSRLPLPASDSPDDPEWLAIPVCDTPLGGGDVNVVDPSAANPCRINAPRSNSALFHNFRYEGEQVSALRFSNPVFSIVLDLSSLEFLTRNVPGLGDQAWPADFARFRRSRIPRGYWESFRIGEGYRYFADFLVLEGRPVTLPVRIVPAPEQNVAFIVDGSGPGSTASIRGQVLRVFLGDTVLSDEAFTGVR